MVALNVVAGVGIWPKLSEVLGGKEKAVSPMASRDCRHDLEYGITKAQPSTREQIPFDLKFRCI